MSPEDDLTILGNLAGALADEDQPAALQLTDRLVGLLGNPTDVERATKLRELADLLADFGTHLRARAADLDPVVVDGAIRRAIPPGP
jgi:hypothetical protein